MGTALLLPGLGSDETLFKYQKGVFDSLIVPKWIPPEKEESLTSYALRLSKTLDLKAVACVGGISFGGMIALELSAITSIEPVLLLRAPGIRGY